MSAPRLPNDGEQLELVIEGMDDEGRGRAVVGDDESGFDVAVRGAFPGDRVRARVERVWATRRLVQACVASVIVEGDARAPRACPHGAPCPACPLEGAEPSLALALKRGRVEAALAEHGLDVDVDDVVAPPSRHGRRQKVKLVVGGRPGHIVLGLYTPHSHTLAAAQLCPYVEPAVARACERVREALSSSQAVPGGRGVRAVVVRAFADGIGVVVQTGAPLAASVRDALAALVPDPLASLAVRVEDRETNSLLGGERELVAGRALLVPREGGPPVSPDAFAQPDAMLSLDMNARAAAFLLDGVHAHADDTGDDDMRHEDARDDDARVFVDAYAGTGGFARALLARGAHRVVAIERSPDVAALADDARVEVHQRDVGVVGAALLARGVRAGGVVADPARRGLGDDVRVLAALDAPRFVLVSCDPDAMGRDVRALCDAGYRVVRVTPVDLFPGTPEIEAMVFLDRTHDDA